ncbi:hypothetical protein GIB67_040281 [Kingdonia uniflora]|uniref:RNase H type-1 domain-containing protein n=1 Tax=Kingdonia uniflora TaxID=39325 RepID=A0A7J7MVC5_9MAGN|nr:hypothetical protein GIB67_040281 [Kingdonia uniflora]
MAIANQLVNKTLYNEEELWCQKARVNWLKFGNHNTSYFYALAQIKRNKSLIHVIQTENGRLLEDQDDFKAHIVHFFSDKFTFKDHPKADLVLSQETYGQVFITKKSKLYLEAMNNDKKQKVKDIFRFDEGCQPATYLSIPLVQGTVTKEILRPLALLTPSEIKASQLGGSSSSLDELSILDFLCEDGDCVMGKFLLMTMYKRKALHWFLDVACVPTVLNPPTTCFGNVLSALAYGLDLKTWNQLVVFSYFWELPNHGEIKINTDGAARGNPGKGGIGCIFRDSDNKVLGSLSQGLGLVTNYRAECGVHKNDVSSFSSPGSDPNGFRNVRSHFINGDERNLCPLKGLPNMLLLLLKDHLVSADPEDIHDRTEVATEAREVGIASFQGITILNDFFNQLRKLPISKIQRQVKRMPDIIVFEAKKEGVRSGFIIHAASRINEVPISLTMPKICFGRNVICGWLSRGRTECGKAYL